MKTGGMGFLLWPFAGITKTLSRSKVQFSEQVPKIGLNLNSLNNDLKHNPKDTVKKINLIGFAGLETSHTFDGITPDDYGKILKKSGLDVISMHVELPVDKVSRESVLKRVKIFKCNTIVWHGLPESGLYRSEEGIGQLANRYNEANSFARSNGLRFGIHNHWWEFEKLSNGRLPFDILLEKLDEDIFFELDVYWIAVAGLDPVQVIRKLGSRVKILQVKDGPAEWSASLDEPTPYPVSAVGTGKMNYPAIFEAAKGNVEWIIVEIEACETDMIQALYESYRYLAVNNYGNGLK